MAALGIAYEVLARKAADADEKVKASAAAASLSAIIRLMESGSSRLPSSA